MKHQPTRLERNVILKYHLRKEFFYPQSNRLLIYSSETPSCKGTTIIITRNNLKVKKTFFSGSAEPSSPLPSSLQGVLIAVGLIVLAGLLAFMTVAVMYIRCRHILGIK